MERKAHAIGGRNKKSGLEEQNLQPDFRKDSRWPVFVREEKKRSMKKPA
jgi:hypothetical protein